MMQNFLLKIKVTESLLSSSLKLTGVEMVFILRRFVTDITFSIKIYLKKKQYVYQFTVINIIKIR